MRCNPCTGNLLSNVITDTSQLLLQYAQAQVEPTTTTATCTATATELTQVQTMAMYRQPPLQPIQASYYWVLLRSRSILTIVKRLPRKPKNPQQILKISTLITEKCADIFDCYDYRSTLLHWPTPIQQGCKFSSPVQPLVCTYTFLVSIFLVSTFLVLLAPRSYEKHSNAPRKITFYAVLAWRPNLITGSR